MLLPGGLRPRLVDAFVALVALGVPAVLTVEAFLPRPDWHAPARLRSHPVFVAHVGELLRRDKLEHGCAGFVLTLLATVALLRFRRGMSDRPAAVAALLLCLLWAGALETGQGFLAYRSFELLDFAACALGSVLAVVAFLTFAPRLRNRWPSTRPTSAAATTPPSPRHSSGPPAG